MKLGDIARESRETFKGDKSGIPIVGLEHIVPQELTFSNYDIDTDNTFTKVFRKGQILFGRRRAYLKKAAVAQFDGICSGDITVIEAIPGMVDENLLPFIIQNDALFDYAVSRSAGGLSPRVKWEQLADYEVDLPSLEEQKVLADKLWAAYRLKEGYKKLLAATDEMVKSQFIEMFGNGKIWSTYRADMLFDLQMGKTPARNNHSYWINSGSPWVSIADMDIDSIYINDTKETISDIAIKDSNIKIVPKGTIIMSFKLTIGRVCIAQRDLYTNEAIMAFIEKGTKDFIEHKPIRFAKRWLFHYLQNKNWLTDSKQAVKGNTLNKQSIGNTYLEVPEYELQEEFAKIAHQADKSKSNVQLALEKVNNTLKQLQEAA